MALKRTLRPITAALALAFVSTAALATDGYFAEGYGMRARGMGGASFATALDAFGGANNPASMAFVGNRVDLGIYWFSPDRGAERTGAMAPINGSATSEETSFWVPEFGVNWMLNPDVALGLTIYGNGGMNTTYAGGQINCGAGPANLLCGQGQLGVDMSQLIVAPTVAWKFAPDHSVGLSPLFAYQRFEAYGLQAFDNAPGFPPFTMYPGNVTNKGYDSSTGWGFRLGYQGRFDQFRVAAVYTSKMSMGDLEAYKGLFAEQGGFDIPSHWGLGVAWEPDGRWLVAFDYERINYSDVKSVNNPSNLRTPLGSDNGPGFGWQDIDVFRVGVQYRIDPTWTVRAGYNHADNPITSRDVTFNILAPGVIENSIGLGFSYAINPASEITVAYTHAFKSELTGSSLFNNVLGPGAGGNEKIWMSQDSLGIAWSMKF
ncbi:MAG TPA: porin [Burkholderiaceae bacterium]|nr:porin [Burkholderiaceae bacterium]